MAFIAPNSACRTLFLRQQILQSPTRRPRIGPWDSLLKRSCPRSAKTGIQHMTARNTRKGSFAIAAPILHLERDRVNRCAFGRDLDHTAQNLERAQANFRDYPAEPPPKTDCRGRSLVPGDFSGYRIPIGRILVKCLALP